MVKFQKSIKRHVGFTSLERRLEGGGEAMKGEVSFDCKRRARKLGGGRGKGWFRLRSTS